MQRIATADVEVDKHGSGKDGFTDGDAGTGTPATEVDAAWFDAVQEELANAVEGSGRTLDAADHGQLAAVLDAINAATFGDGSDGPFTVSSGTTALSRDMYYTDGEVTGTAIVRTTGFRMFFTGTCRVGAGAAITADGGDGSSSSIAAGGPYAATGSLRPGGFGGSGGGTGAVGNDGSGLSEALGGSGGAGGASSDGNAGGAAGAASAPVNALGGVSIRHAPGWLGYVQGLGGVTPVAGGGGGGGGGGSATEAGRGGGAGGGVVSICAKRLIVEAGARISADGGDGGSNSTVATPGGSGGGGGGGLVLLATRYREIAGTVSAAGGAGGTSLHGNAGAAGADGRVVYYDV